MARTKKVVGAAKEAKPNEVAKKPKYLVKVMVNSQSQELEGETLLEALKTLVIPSLIKTEVEFIVTAGDKAKRWSLIIPKARRLFANKTSLELFASNLNKMLG